MSTHQANPNGKTNEELQLAIETLAEGNTLTQGYWHEVGKRIYQYTQRNQLSLTNTVNINRQCATREGGMGFNELRRLTGINSASMTALLKGTWPWIHTYDSGKYYLDKKELLIFLRNPFKCPSIQAPVGAVSQSQFKPLLPNPRVIPIPPSTINDELLVLLHKYATDPDFLKREFTFDLDGSRTYESVLTEIMNNIDNEMYLICIVKWLLHQPRELVAQLIENARIDGDIYDTDHIGSSWFKKTYNKIMYEPGSY